MRRFWFGVWAFLFVWAFFPPAVFPQEKPGGRVHGLVFGDYFYKLSGNSAEVSPSQYSKVDQDFQAFQFRRLYLYYDQNINEKFFTQFLIEGNDKTLDPGGKLGLVIKAAYLEWKEIIPKGRLGVGLYPTPTFAGGTPEKAWNYRSVEKTVGDSRGLGIPTDLGISLRGAFGAGNRFGYAVMIGNGTGLKPENNKFKKFYGMLNARPVKEVILEAYADYEPGTAGKNISTLKGFAAYQVSRLTGGIEAVYQTQQKVALTGDDKTPFGIAFFAWAPVSSVEKLNVFARFDFFNPNTQVTDSGFNENFFTAGLDYMPVKNVHFMPNLWLNSFSDKSPAGVSKDADVAARLTFYYIYE